MAQGVKTGGRVKGTPNKATAEIKDIAQKYGPEAVEKLWQLAELAQSEQARVAALREILDRGYGKPTTFIEGEITLNPLQGLLDAVDGRAKTVPETD